MPRCNKVGGFESIRGKAPRPVSCDRGKKDRSIGGAEIGGIEPENRDDAFLS